MQRNNKPTRQQIFLDVVKEATQEKETEQPKENIQAKLIKEYEALQKRKEEKYKAYKVIFDGVKDLAFISFQTGDSNCRWKATYEATKFFKENFHPLFMTEDMLYKARGYRIQKLDKYCKEGKAPIPVLMEKAGLKFPCRACGKGNFDYEDYEFRRCYVTEEVNFYPYAKGVVLCKKCFDKYMGNR